METALLFLPDGTLGKLALEHTRSYICPEGKLQPSGTRMPIKEGKRYCVNHPNARMNRTESLKALVNMKGNAQDGTINPTSGLVVMPFVCEECGYLELYVADRTQHEKL